MSNLRLIYPNEADTATLSCSPAEVASMPVANLQDMRRGYPWRSDGVVSGQHILGNFSGYKACSGIALVRHNLTAAGTWRLRLYDGVNQTGNLLYDSGVTRIAEQLLGWGRFRWGIDPWGAATAKDWPAPYFAGWFAKVVAASFDLELSDTANPDGYLQASRLIIGDYFSPAYNVSYGLAMAWRENTRQTRTEGGTLNSDAGPGYREFSMSFDLLPQDDRNILVDIFRRAGLRNDIFIACMPGQGGALERDHTALVKLVQTPDTVASSYRNFAANKINLQES